MNTRRPTTSRTGLRAAAAVLALTLAGGAMAQGFPGRDVDMPRHPGGPAHGQRFDHGPRFEPGPRFDRGPRFAHEAREHRMDRRLDQGPRRMHGPAGPGHDYRPGVPRPYVQWQRGGYVPTAYRAPQYVVNDWRARQLQAPPAGYHWLQVNGDFVLGAIAGGLIAAIVAAQ